MRTAIFIVCGFLPWGVCIAAAKFTSGVAGAPLTAATAVAAFDR